MTVSRTRPDLRVKAMLLLGKALFHDHYKFFSASLFERGFLNNNEQFKPVSTYLHKEILNLLYVIIFNVDENNQGNKAYVQDYLQKALHKVTFPLDLPAGCEQLLGFGFTCLQEGLETLNNLIEVHMHENNAPALTPPPLLANINFSLPVLTIVYHIFYRRNQIEYAPALAAIKLLLSCKSSETIYEQLKQLLMKESNFKGENQSLYNFPTMPAFKKILQPYLGIKDAFLAAGFKSSSSSLAALAIDYYRGNLAPTNYVIKKQDDSDTICIDISQKKSFTPTLKQSEHTSQTKSNINFDLVPVDAKHHRDLPPEIKLIDEKINEIIKDIQNKQKIKRPNNLFNISKVLFILSESMSKLRLALDVVIKERSHSSLINFRKILIQEYNFIHGEKNKYSPEFPQWHLYQTVQNNLIQADGLFKQVLPRLNDSIIKHIKIVQN